MIKPKIISGFDLSLDFSRVTLDEDEKSSCFLLSRLENGLITTKNLN